MARDGWGEIYKELGATPVINAIGSVTMLGGSTPVPEVKAMMERAESAYIPLANLEEKAGQAIAEMVGVPAAYVTSGAGSALTLSTAAFMAGDDDDKIQQLPDTTGMKNEILIQTRQRYWYDRCLELAGAKLVEFGGPDKVTAEDLERAINEKTAAVHYVAYEQNPTDPNALSLEKTVEVAKKKGVPVMVDAAGQIYPVENFSKYVKMGADVSCVAAKYMSAPQSTGLALGTAETIRKLALQSFISYEHRRVRGVGRPQKIDRTEIVGVVAAVKRWMTLNHEERLASVETQCRTMMAPLRNVRGLRVELNTNVIGHQPFGVNIWVDAAQAGISAQEVVDRLKAGDPPIWTRTTVGEPDRISLHSFGLNPGEDKIVGERIAAILKK